MQSQNKQWSWMDCNLTIKRASKKNQNQVFEILESQYTIQLEEDSSEAQLNIEVSMEKRINYEDGSGFTWHKSWNIPSIQVKISKRDLNAIKSQLGISRVYCQITSGYPIRKMVQFYIQEVVVQGQTRKQIGSNGVARFSNLKFSETSFNHERNKFSLILIVFTKNEERSRSVLKSFISMPIYVDSRKEARKKQPTNIFLSELIPVQAFQEELQQRHLDKKQAKAKSKTSKVQLQSQLESRGQGKNIVKYSLAGFISYYKSANIRNKIKHPFYFSYHFHQLITLYFNRQIVNSPVAALKYIEKPSKHDSKKILLVTLSPAVGEENEQILQDLKKQFLNLFQNNWKYYFIEVAIKGNIYFNFMIQEKVTVKAEKNEEGAQTETKKWVELTPHEILNAYSDYYADIENRQNEENKNSFDSDSQPALQNEVDNGKKYEHFQLHQVIHIQSAFKQSEPCKKVKVQAQYEHDYHEQ